ncbi:MAG: hypothetical protein NTX76_02380 [Alphaproteobacteria bacterium]|nr:hypothetical protein [Alphaproteobacteria bacterium]
MKNLFFIGAIVATNMHDVHAMQQPRVINQREEGAAVRELEHRAGRDSSELIQDLGKQREAAVADALAQQLPGFTRAKQQFMQLSEEGVDGFGPLIEQRDSLQQKLDEMNRHYERDHWKKSLYPEDVYKKEQEVQQIELENNEGYKTNPQYLALVEQVRDIEKSVENSKEVRDLERIISFYRTKLMDNCLKGRNPDLDDNALVFVPGDMGKGEMSGYIHLREGMGDDSLAAIARFYGNQEYLSKFNELRQQLEQVKKSTLYEPITQAKEDMIKLQKEIQAKTAVENEPRIAVLNDEIAALKKPIDDEKAATEEKLSKISAEIKAIQEAWELKIKPVRDEKEALYDSDAIDRISRPINDHYSTIQKEGFDRAFEKAMSEKIDSLEKNDHK